MRAQIELARREGVHLVLIAPMVCGVATLVALKREFDDMMFIAHPSLGGLRIAPQALFGKLFRLFGADAVIFPNHGGRFSYPRDVCHAIATSQHATVARLETRIADARRGDECRPRGRNGRRVRT